MLTRYADFAVFVAGLALVIGGVSRWSWPAAVVAGGLVLMAVAIWPGGKAR